MSREPRVIVSFGKTDPLRLTEATHKLLGEGPTYIWGPDFGKPKPSWAIEIVGRLYDELGYYEVVYCGHGATLLEATAAGCEVMALSRVLFPQMQTISTVMVAEKVEFIPAWTGSHLDHSGRRVAWWEPGSMARMAAEIRGRR